MYSCKFAQIYKLHVVLINQCISIVPVRFILITSYASKLFINIKEINVTNDKQIAVTQKFMVLIYNNWT